MGIGQSSKIITDGLLLYYDRDNLKSYKGPAIQNLATTIAGVTQSGTGYSFTAGSETVDIPTLGSLTAQTTYGYNNYSAVSAACCINLFYYVTGNSWVTCSPSTLYTYSIVYKSISGYTHPNFMYRYEYNSGTYVGEAGVHNDSNRIHLGGGWYWAWGTFTTSATTNQLYLRYFYYNYGTAYDKMYVAKVLVAAGNYTSLHPKYWPDVGVTRSNTSVLYDISGQNNSITANSLTYNSDGMFSFNGSSDLITIPNNTALDNQAFTVSVWVKTNATTQNGFWFEKGTVNSQYALFQEGAYIKCRINNGSTLVDTIAPITANFMNTTSWYNVVFTFISGTQICYINGNVAGTGTTTATVATNSGGMSIGVYGGYSGGRGYYYNGSIANVKVYNRALSAAEVRQNFSALRGRFGV